MLSHANKTPYLLSPLPYDQNALEPYLSARTLDFHYGRHHQGYLNKLNELVAGKELEKLSLEALMLKTVCDEKEEAIFNNGAQVWNHTFMWNSLTPKSGNQPSHELLQKIGSSFGGYEKFLLRFIQTGVEQFGSGWVWLISKDGGLDIIKTSNAQNPISLGKGTPLLGLDVWEHAYYLDYQNRRHDYLTTLMEHLLNWNFAAENLSRA